MSDAPSLYRATIRLSLESPFLIQGLPAKAHGIDAAQMRDHCDRPIIPYSEVKGVLRHALEMLPGHAVPDWLGIAFGLPDDAETRGSRLIFSDLVCEVGQSALRSTRVKLDANTGAVASGQLQVVELVRPIGDIATFTGNVTFVAEDDRGAAEVVALLNRGFALVRAIGAFKTVGFGRLVSAPDKQLPVRSLENVGRLAPGTPLKHETFMLRFTLDRPLLVDTAQISGNVFLGSSVVPGSVLKGALATKLDLAGLIDEAMDEALERLTIGHAFPFVAGRAVDETFPKSLVLVGSKTSPALLDAAIPGEWERALDLDLSFVGRDDHHALAFGPDWKTCKPVWLPSEKHTRTRVRIDPETGAAQHGQLFSQVTIPPVVRGEPIQWQCQVAWPADPHPSQRRALAQISAALADGLFGIGKTKAIMVRESLTTTPVEECLRPIGNEVRVMLTTAHLMLRCRDLTDEQTYHSALTAYWDRVGDGAFSLAVDDGGPRVFASQSLVGGQQMVNFNPFNDGEDGDEQVEPFVLMDPGSVFVLEVRNADRTRAILQKWVLHGLPTFTEAHWTNCPFMPENGYGAITVDPPKPRMPEPAGAAS